MMNPKTSGAPSLFSHRHCYLKTWKSQPADIRTRTAKLSADGRFLTSVPSVPFVIIQILVLSQNKKIHRISVFACDSNFDLPRVFILLLLFCLIFQRKQGSKKEKAFIILEVGEGPPPHFCFMKFHKAILIHCTLFIH